MIVRSGNSVFALKFSEISVIDRKCGNNEIRSINCFILRKLSCFIFKVIIIYMINYDLFL